MSGTSGKAARDPLATALAASAVVHAVLLFGIGFSAREAAPVTPTLDVMISGARTPLSPKEAEFLAQVNNEGGGEHDKSARPGAPQSGPLPLPQDGLAEQPMQAQSPQSAPHPEARIVSSTRSPLERPAPENRPDVPPDALPPGRELVPQNLEMARLAAEIQRNSELYAKRPRRKFVSASTKEYVYAEYLRRWVERVERVGNLNYPEAAKQRNLSGKVVVSIGIRRDGRVESTEVLVGSGQPILDQAALRIARLAEPYPPLPRSDEPVDVLNVVRTWVFQPGGTFADE